MSTRRWTNTSVRHSNSNRKDIDGFQEPNSRYSTWSKLVHSPSTFRETTMTVDPTLHQILSTKHTPYRARTPNRNRGGNTWVYQVSEGFSMQIISNSSSWIVNLSRPSPCWLDLINYQWGLSSDFIVKSLDTSLQTTPNHAQVTNSNLYSKPVK